MDRVAQDRARRRRASLRAATTDELAVVSRDQTGAETRVAALEAADVAIDARLDALEADFRVKAVSPGQSITDNTATFVDWSSADAFDDGAWHDHASGTLDVREKLVVPSGGAGTYLVVVNLRFANHTHPRTLLVELMVDTGGGYVADPSVLAGMLFGNTVVDEAVQLSVVLALSVGHQLKVRVTSADQAGADALALSSGAFTVVRWAA